MNLRQPFEMNHFWADILGNAYISLFFSSGQNPQMSQQALSAYSQAVSEDMHTHSKLLKSHCTDNTAYYDCKCSVSNRRKSTKHQL